LTAKTEDPNFWSAQNIARSVMREKTYLEDTLSSIKKLENDLQYYNELLEMQEIEEDEEFLQSIISEIQRVSQSAKQQEMNCLFSGEADPNDCFLEIHAGAGGTESHDWASMLMRMYIRFAERHDFKVESVDLLSGEEAGIKSVTLKIRGHNAYGWLRTETGVHRLVRISPFNSAGKRHTSFCSVKIYPVVDQNIDIAINESDLRIDTYRSSGAGGQHVNTTDSAVRITHIPTNIVVQSQSNRSQHKNKDECMSMLRAKIYEIELKRKEAEAMSQHATQTDIAWGHQIRSYVLQPYQMVKDLRSGHSQSDIGNVLDGKLDDIIYATLASLMTGEGATGSLDLE
jgi:peptide chain release factor 2